MARGTAATAPSDVSWLVMVTRLRATGMPIRMIRRYAELVRAGEGNEAERLALLEAHRDGGHRPPRRTRAQPRGDRLQDRPLPRALLQLTLKRAHSFDLVDLRFRGLENAPRTSSGLRVGSRGASLTRSQLTTRRARCTKAKSKPSPQSIESSPCSVAMTTSRPSPELITSGPGPPPMTSIPAPPTISSLPWPPYRTVSDSAGAPGDRSRSDHPIRRRRGRKLRSRAP